MKNIMDQSIMIKPIGSVREMDGKFRLQLGKQYAAGLDGLKDFSHALVFWWAHHFDREQDRRTLSADIPHSNAPDRMGIFATRSPIRPNPIALTAVKIISIDQPEGIVDIASIDAEDGTPIIDIKPYHPSADRIRDVSIPEWCSHWPEWYEDSAEFDWESEFNY